MARLTRWGCGSRGQAVRPALVYRLRGGRTDREDRKT
jgi:hypothetical protein